MRINVKTILVGGIIFYATAFVLSMISGAVIHEGVLDPLYRATNDFWRPELQQDPPDMAALMPRWIATGLLTTFVFVAIFDNIRDSLNGSGLVKGLKFGMLLGLINACISVGWSGVFNLPDTIWVWWSIDAFVLYSLAGMALGWYVGKFGSD
jgi:hypothetical protein